MIIPVIGPSMFWSNAVDAKNREVKQLEENYLVVLGEYHRQQTRWQHIAGEFELFGERLAVKC